MSPTTRLHIEILRACPDHVAFGVRAAFDHSDRRVLIVVILHWRVIEIPNRNWTQTQQCHFHKLDVVVAKTHFDITVAYEPGPISKAPIRGHSVGAQNLSVDARNVFGASCTPRLATLPLRSNRGPR